MTLSITALYHYAEICHYYAECHYAEYRYAECRGADVKTTLKDGFSLQPRDAYAKRFTINVSSISNPPM